MQKVLCVCYGNTCRSPMMQALLQGQLGDEFQVESAGVRREATGKPANEHTLLCMQERGIDLMSHRSRWVGDLDLTQYSHIICVGENEAGQVSQYLSRHHSTVVRVANGDYGGVPNPHGKGLAAYRECLVLLDEIMPEVAQQIR